MNKNRKSPHRSNTVAITTLVATGSFMLGILATSIVTNLTTESATSPVEATTPACPTEDSNGCFWDAQAHGTTGKSFYADEAGNLYYLPVAVTETPEYQSVAECAKQLKGFSRDAMALSAELTGYWAQQAAASEDGALSNTTYGEWVITDNLQPMQDRYDYLLREFCS